MISKGKQKKTKQNKTPSFNFTKLKDDIQNMGILISLYYFSSHLLFKKWHCC